MPSSPTGLPANSASKNLAPPRYLYLHGFASGPASRKARFFAERLAAEGISLAIPSLDCGDFENLTISAQLEVVHSAAGEDTVVLIGSSMGGYVAALYAARHPRVRGVCLLAPAFGFLDLWLNKLGPEDVECWRVTGAKQVFHYGLGRETALQVGLLKDAAKYEPKPHFAAPALIFHGNQDDVVPVDSSVQYSRAHPNVQLVRLDTGHELTDVLEIIWQRAKPFLLGVGPPLEC